jgi:hypothetical protein
MKHEVIVDSEKAIALASYSLQGLAKLYKIKFEIKSLNLNLFVYFQLMMAISMKRYTQQTIWKR